jgi:ABC-2 type transport system permease protein
MFAILKKEITEFLREKTNVFFYLLFPVLLVFLLGSFLGNLDKAEAVIGEIQVQYAIETEDPQTLTSVEAFIDAIKADGTMVMEKTGDVAAAKTAVAEGKISAVIVFEEPLGIQIWEGSNRINNRAITAVMKGFAQTSQAISAVAVTASETLGQLDSSAMDTDHVSPKDLGVNRTMLDYYAIAMLIMLTMMCSMSGAYAFTRERASKTLNRLILSPKNRWALYLQKIFGTIPQIILQISIMMVISVFVFGAHYARTFQGNAFLFLMYFVIALALISLGALLGLFLKADPSAILLPLLWITMFFGGTFSKDLYIESISPYMPSYIIAGASFDITLFGRYEQGLKVTGTAGLILAITLVAGVIVFNRMEEQR